MTDEKSWGSLIINNAATIFSLLHKENKGEDDWSCELYSVDYFPINLIHQNAELLNMALVCRAFFKSFSSFINDHLTFRCMKDDSFQHYQPKLIKVAPSSNISFIPTSATFIKFFSCSRTIQLHSFPPLSSSLSSLTIDLSSYSGPLSFPSSLTYLNITTIESFFDLPPNLIELKFQNKNMDMIDFSKWKFSPSLSHLTIKCGDFTSFTSLPTSLSHLSVNSFGSEDQYTWLPPSLIYLNITIQFFNGNLPIPSFPSSLQYLFISCSGEEITQLPPLPKSIKTLSLPSLSHPLQSYPPNLIHLAERNFYDNLPPFPNLQSLCLSIFMEQEQMFPSSLKSFRGKAAWMMSNLSPSSSLSHLSVMDPGTSFQIPNSVTHLTLHFANYIPPLPPNIIDLKLFYISPLSSLPSSFPEGLQHLSIMSHDDLDNDIILSFPSSLLSLQLPVCKCILPPLPPNLQILSLGFYKGRPFPIKLFPESLRTLNIHSYEEDENQGRLCHKEKQKEEKQEEEKQKEERQEIQELIQLPKGLMNLQCDIAWLEANQIVPPVSCLV